MNSTSVSDGDWLNLEEMFVTKPSFRNEGLFRGIQLFVDAGRVVKQHIFEQHVVKQHIVQ